MLNLINKETRQIPGWPVVQGRGVDRVRSTQPPPRGWETLLVISRCLASLSHPLWHSPSQCSLSKAARYVHHIRTRQSRIMIDVRRINRTRAMAVATRCSNASRLSSLGRHIFRLFRNSQSTSDQQDSNVLAKSESPESVREMEFSIFNIAFFRFSKSPVFSKEFSRIRCTNKSRQGFAEQKAAIRATR